MLPRLIYSQTIPAFKGEQLSLWEKKHEDLCFIYDLFLIHSAPGSIDFLSKAYELKKTKENDIVQQDINPAFPPEQPVQEL